MAEIPVQRTTGVAPIWPWLLGLLLLAGVGLVIWAVAADDETVVHAGRGASMSVGGEAGAPAVNAGGERVVAVVNPPGAGNTTVGIAKPTGAGEVVAVGKPAGADTPTVAVVDRVEADETAAQAARDAAVTAAMLAVEPQPMKLAGRAFVLDDAEVTEVTGDKVFWVSPQGSDLTYLAVWDEQKAPRNGVEGRYDIGKGMRLSLVGDIQRLDTEGAKALSLDASAVDRAGGAGAVYLRVDKVTILEGAKANANRFDKDRLVVEERIFFAYNSAALTPTGRAKLDDIAAELKGAGRDWQLLRIAGYSDGIGPRDYNQDLSRDRAKAVEGYLTTLGVKGGKLDTKAYGESRPLEIDASSPEEYQRNRRVEFTIVRAP